MAKLGAKQSKDPAALGRAVILALKVYLGLTVLAVVGEAVEMTVLAGLPSEMPLDPSEPVPGNVLLELVASLTRVGSAAAFLVSGVMTLVWIYRVNHNARTLVKTKRISPGWAVGWYFVPIASLWKPFQAMAETWRISTEPDSPAGVEVPNVMRWWWGLWLVSGIVGNLGFRLSLQARDVSSTFGSDGVEVVGDVLAILTTLTLIWIVRQLTQRQVSSLSRLAFA